MEKAASIQKQGVGLPIKNLSRFNRIPCKH